MKYQFAKLPPVLAMSEAEAMRELCAIHGRVKIHGLIACGVRRFAKDPDVASKSHKENQIYWDKKFMSKLSSVIEQAMITYGEGELVVLRDPKNKAEKDSVYVVLQDRGENCRVETFDESGKSQKLIFLKHEIKHYA